MSTIEETIGLLLVGAIDSFPVHTNCKHEACRVTCSERVLFADAFRMGNTVIRHEILRVRIYRTPSRAQLLVGVLYRDKLCLVKDGIWNAI